MLPLNADGTQWSAVNAQRAIKEIREQCQDDLRKRDSSRGIPANGQVYVDNTPEADMTGRLEVNQELSRRRSTGADFNKLFRSRCAAFCAVPQDEEAFRATHRKEDRDGQAATAKAAAADVEQTLVDESTAPEPETPKRRVGRPTNAEKAARESELEPAGA